MHHQSLMTRYYSTDGFVAKHRLDYRPPRFLIDTVFLDFELSTDATVVTAESAVRRNPDGDDDGGVLELDGGGALELLSVSVDGRRCVEGVHYRRLGPQLHVVAYPHSDDGVAALPERFQLGVVTKINPSSNSALDGLFLSDGVFCTQCEPEGFRKMTYFVDRPDVLARYRTRITAPKALCPHLLSNGNVVARGEHADGVRHWIEWQDPFAKPSYLFALVAGHFDVLEDSYRTRSGRDVLLQIFVQPGNVQRADWALRCLQRAMRWDEQRFELEYDLDRYMIVAVDFFCMGAMENKGLNVFNAKYVLVDPALSTDRDYANVESVVGHEYFHNYTGNRVTCRDWFQLSLKEGLTVFRDQEFSADMGSRTCNRIRAVQRIRGAQFLEDAGPTAHPIRPELVKQMNNFYSVTIYDKGAEVVRMLHTLLGEQRFKQGLLLYLRRHDGAAATCDQFVDAMQDAADGAVDLTQFRRWYAQSGTPQLLVTDEYDAASRRYVLHVRQVNKPTADQHDKLPLHVPLSTSLYAGHDGQPIAMRLCDSDNDAPFSRVLDVRQPLHSFAFADVPCRPVVSLLRGFSAPVRLDYPYTDEQLIFLVRHASDPLARWDASQTLFSKYILLNSNATDDGAFVFPLAAVDALGAACLGDSVDDPALAAQILALPREEELFVDDGAVDPLRLRRVRDWTARTIAGRLAPQLLARYHALQLDSYRVQHDDIAKRDLRRQCLWYLAFVGAEHDALAARQYHSADNMTDALAALSAAVDASLPCRDALLHHFDQRWRHEPLALDKLFALSAAIAPPEQALARVRALLDHPGFNINNPNRCFALLGAYAAHPVSMHDPAGHGYQFLADTIVQLDRKIPIVSARLVAPLTKYRRFQPHIQAAMRAALQQIQAVDNLSPDLAEQLEKALK